MKEKESASTGSRSTSGESTEYSFDFAPRALRDIDDAMAWLTEEASREVAERWAHTLYEKILTLAIFPERCPVAVESAVFDEEVRQLLLGKGRSQYRVLYSVRGRVVRVETIRRSARDQLEP